MMKSLYHYRCIASLMNMLANIPVWWSTVSPLPQKYTQHIRASMQHCTFHVSLMLMYFKLKE